MAVNLTPFVLRKPPGNSGKPTKVRANFFEMATIPTSNVQQIYISFQPENLPPSRCREVWENFRTTIGASFLKNTQVIYDGRHAIYSPIPLHFGDSNSGKSFDLNLRNETRSKSENIKIHLKPVGIINMTELQMFLDGRSSLTNNCLSAISVLDILLRQLPSMLYTTIGRSFYVNEGGHPLQNGTKARQGYYQSARPTKGKMMINVDLSATTFYEEGILSELVAKVLNRRSVDELRQGISHRDILRLEKLYKGIRIMTNHRGERKIKYKIERLTPKGADQTYFKDENGENVSVSHYFTRQYNQRLSYPFLPCVVVKKNVFFPMEICEVLPGQRYMKKLNEKQTAEMIKFTCQNPNSRVNKIKQGVDLLKYKENPYFDAFGVHVKNEMATIDARVLNTPKIHYHDSSQEADLVPQFGAWNLRGKKVYKGESLEFWSIVNFTPTVKPQLIDRFLRELTQTFRDTGVAVGNQKPTIFNADPQGNIESILEDAKNSALKLSIEAAKKDGVDLSISNHKTKKYKPQLILCILPNTGVQLYAEIKRVSDTVIGIASQCVQSKHIYDPKKQYCANVCLKVNQKLGGTNVVLEKKEIPFISQVPTIVFGADVTHPAPGDMNKPSIAAVTASMDSSASCYASDIRVQANRNEIIADLWIMIANLLRTFYRNSGYKPQRILFYRDGVSEGQFNQVYNSEIRAIHKACENIDTNYKPTITFVIVQKRHHARFFPIGKQNSDRTGNCLPGTVIDTNIVHPFEFDFYLQSHAGLQGTSRPTHYHVLYDDNNFTSDSLQELTYRLCYIYGRATRSVSMVPAAYYAHLLAARARFHRRGENWSDTNAPSESLDFETLKASYGAVMPALKSVMYYM